MESITKTNLAYKTIEVMAKKALGNAVKIRSITELKDGFYNTAYMLELQNEKAILKVSPPKNVKVMRYEKNLMQAEVSALRKMKARTGIPVPAVLYYDNSEEIIENDYFFMEFVEGISLYKIKNELEPKQLHDISTQLAKIVTEINKIDEEYFGYLSQEDKRFSTWSEAFLFMVREVLEDAEDADVTLPYGCKAIYDMFSKHQSSLEKVNTPSLVHKDLWEGNIFIDPKTCQINGIIDCERAVFGDALMDPVCGFLVENSSFMQTYLGRTVLADDEYIRSILYKTYLFLIMVIECSYRLYPDGNQEKWTRKALSESIECLLKF